MNVNKVTYVEVERLNDIQLSKLLLLLLSKEAERFQFTGIEKILVPLKINVGDGGEDGRIECEDTNGSIYISNKLSLFQCKATDLSETEIFNEFFIKKKSNSKATKAKKLVLKEKIKEVLDQGGQYVFFISHGYNTNLSDRRLKGARNAISDYNDLEGTNYTSNQVKILEGNTIANWVNEHLEAVILVQRFNGITRPIGLKTIDELGDFDRFNAIQFYSNEKLDRYMQQILETTKNPRTSLRIIGHSGLGKSRLVYESLKGLGKNSDAVYYNVTKDAQGIIDFVISHSTTLSGTLIVDNCDYKSHRLLKEEIDRFNSKFKLITIDYNVAEESDVSKTNSESYIFLKNSDYFLIVKQILAELFGRRLEPIQIDQIADFAEGFPGMAVLFGRARLRGSENLTELLEDEMIQRLAFGRDWESRDNRKLEMLKSFSIFSSFGNPDQNSIDLLSIEERNHYDAQKEFIINKICEPVSTHREFMDSSHYFIERQVMERRGNFLSVKPAPLAIKLAMQWWKSYNHIQLVDIFEDLERLNLAIPLVNRLSQLNQLKGAKAIVNDLWGPESPFGKAEVLNTSLGARLFRSISNVNPESSVAALEVAFGEIKIQDLKQGMGPGRRNIIWALEALAFRRQVFERAVRLLFRFAAAENENISNNATGQLMQLFGIKLAGTESDFEQRLSAIDTALSDKEDSIHNLAVDVTINGLTKSTFNRLVGAEFVSPDFNLIDFNPSREQTSHYLEGLVQRLVMEAKTNINQREKIKEAVAQSIRLLYRNKKFTLVQDSIKAILEFDKTLWINAINNLNDLAEYENLSSNELKSVNDLLENLRPQTLKAQLEYYVSTPLRRGKSDRDHLNFDVAGAEAEKLAESIVENGSDILPVIEILLSGEQRRGFIFGKKLGELTQSVDFVKYLLDALKKINLQDQNPEVIGGYISSLSVEQREQILRAIYNDDLLLRHAFYLTKAQKPNLKDIENLFTLVSDNRLPIAEFYQFSYGRGFHDISEQDALIVLERISKFSGGSVIALELFDDYIGINETRWIYHKSFLKTLLSDSSILALGGRITYTWFLYVKKLLDDSVDSNFWKTISRQILDAIVADRIDSYDGYVKEILIIIIESHFEIFLEIFGESFLNNSSYFKLKFFLGPTNGSMPEAGLLGFGNHEMLIDWCKRDLQRAPLRIAYMMPVSNDKNSKDWHPLALKMIDTFGDQEGFMDEVGANMGSFGYSGSEVPYYKNQIILISVLKTHRTQNVKIWANNMIEVLEKRIKRTILDDQNYQVDR